MACTPPTFGADIGSGSHRPGAPAIEFPGQELRGPVLMPPTYGAGIAAQDRADQAQLSVPTRHNGAPARRSRWNPVSNSIQDFRDGVHTPPIFGADIGPGVAPARRTRH